jgi:hypothetical protein
MDAGNSWFGLGDTKKNCCIANASHSLVELFLLGLL